MNDSGRPSLNQEGNIRAQSPNPAPSRFSRYILYEIPLLVLYIGF